MKSTARLPSASPSVATVQNKGEYLFLHFECPGGQPFPVAALLLDVEQDRLYVEIRSDLYCISPTSDIEIVTQFLADLADDALTQSGRAIVAHLSDTLSTAIRITECTPIELAGIESTLALLRHQLVVLPAQHGK